MIDEIINLNIEELKRNQSSNSALMTRLGGFEKFAEWGLF